MDDHMKALLAATQDPDIEMINDVIRAVTELAKKWKREDKLGPQAMSALMIVVAMRYMDAKLASEGLPLFVSFAWGVANTMKREEVVDEKEEKREVEGE